MRDSGTSGFTLVELLVVTGILAVLLAAIGASLAGGIRAWDAARDFNSVETDAMVDLEIMHRDIANTFRFHDIAFRGSKTAMSFPGLLPEDRTGEPAAPAAGADAEVRRIGTVSYFFDAPRNALFRNCRFYPGATEDAARQDGEEVIGRLAAVAFEYYRLPSEPGRDGAWIGAWEDATNLPARVKVELTFAGDARPRTITRTMVIPTVRIEGGTKDG